MPRFDAHYIEVDDQCINLRNRVLAAGLAWLWPGAGHLYQRRYFKGWLMMVCILTTFFFGFAIGGGRVVYASFAPGDFRWHYVLQSAVGLPAFPALVQLKHIVECEDAFGNTKPNYEPYWNGWMAPPERPVRESQPDQLADWHLETGAGFELGSWYTVIAGLLNLFVIFDAYGGPLDIAISGRKPDRPNDKENAS